SCLALATSVGVAHRRAIHRLIDFADTAPQRRRNRDPPTRGCRHNETPCGGDPYAALHHAARLPRHSPWCDGSRSRGSGARGWGFLLLVALASRANGTQIYQGALRYRCGPRFALAIHACALVLGGGIAARVSQVSRPFAVTSVDNAQAHYCFA